MGTIVVGFDGSEQSLEALRWAAGQAKISGSRLRIVAGWDIPYNYGAADGKTRPYDRVRNETQQALSDAVDKEVTDPTVRSTVELVAEKGNPTKLLLAESDTAELIVLGARGSGGFRGLILGSTTDNLVKNARCPVVVVRR